MQSLSGGLAAMVSRSPAPTIRPDRRVENSQAQTRPFWILEWQCCSTGHRTRRPVTPSHGHAWMPVCRIDPIAPARPLARANLAASIRWALLSTSKDRSVPLFTRRHDTSEASHDFDRRLAGHGMCDAADALRSQLVLARTRYVGLLLLVPGDNRAPLLLLYQTPPLPPSLEQSPLSDGP